MSGSEYVKPDIKTNFSRGPTIIYFLLVIVLYFFGLISCYLVITEPENQATFDNLTNGIKDLIGVSLPFLPFFLGFIILFLLISLVLGYFVVWLMSKIAMEVTMITIIVFPFFFIVIGLFIGYASLSQSNYDGMVVGFLPMAFGLLLYILVIWKWKSFKRAGQFVEFSAQLTLDEKAVLWAPILMGLFNIVTGLFIIFGMWEINSLFVTTNNSESQLSPIGAIISFVFAYIYLIIYLGVSYSLNALVISYATDWYRGLDPDIKSATKDVKQVFPIIVKFSVAMASIKIIAQVLANGTRNTTTSNRGNAGSMVAFLILSSLAWFVFSIIGAIWMFLNYFTLISIVQNKKGLGESIKDSAKTTWNSFLDVVAGESGYGLTMFVFFFINIIIWAVAGFALGYLMFPDSVIIWIVFAVVLIILSSVFYNMVTFPMKVAFRTFLYSYAKDYLDGFKKPSKLPIELRDEFKSLAQEHDKRRMRDPTQYL
ncbi:MAG: hypothetical protein ACFFD1_14475 [Candidatus Thorarchaeota archaeon]